MSNSPELLIRGGYHLAESPHWCADGNVLYFVNISDCAVHSYSPDTKESKCVKLEAAEGARSLSFAVPVAKGSSSSSSGKEFVVGLDRSVQVLTWMDGDNAYKVRPFFSILFL